jgi:ferredoxin
MSGYRVTIDKTACDGIFACLTRDRRFVEDEDGLATVEAADATTGATASDRLVIAEFADDRIDEARAAAAACPPDAITVEALDEDSAARKAADPEGD